MPTRSIVHVFSSWFHCLFIKGFGGRHFLGFGSYPPDSKGSDPSSNSEGGYPISRGIISGLLYSHSVNSFLSV